MTLRRVLYRSDIELLLKERGRESELPNILIQLVGSKVSNSARLQPLRSKLRTEDDLRHCLSNSIEDQDLVDDVIKLCRMNNSDLELPTELHSLFSSEEKSQKIAFFTGAGCSMLLGLPDWKSLADKAVKYLRNEMGYSFHECNFLKEQFSDPKQLLSLFHTVVSPETKEAKDFYRNTLKRPKGEQKKNIYDIIARLETVKITTNIEDEFATAVDKYLSEARALPSLDSSGSDKPSEIRRTERFCVPSATRAPRIPLSTETVYHLHGTIDTLPKAVLTTKGYIDAYYSPDSKGSEGTTGATSRFLKILFQEYSVIFVGTSLSEFVILESILSSNRIVPTNQHYALLPCFEHNMANFSLYESYLSDFNIQPIPYYRDTEDHDRLFLVLESWAERVSKITKNQNLVEERIFLRQMSKS